MLLGEPSRAGRDCGSAMRSRLSPSPLLASCLLHAAALAAAAVLASPASPRAPVADALAVELIAPPPPEPPPLPPVVKPRPITKLTPPKPVTVPKPLLSPPSPAASPESERIADVTPVRVAEAAPVVTPPAPKPVDGNVVAPPEPQRVAVAPVEGGGVRTDAFGRGDFELTSGSGAGGRSGRGLAANGDSADLAGAAGAPTRDGLTAFARPRGGYQARPAYPETARRAGVEGVTVLRFEVLARGQVGAVLVERSAGHQDLDRAAVEAVRRWRFEPARRGSQPVAVWVTLPVRFELR